MKDKLAVGAVAVAAVALIVSVLGIYRENPDAHQSESEGTAGREQIAALAEQIANLKGEISKLSALQEALATQAEEHAALESKADAPAVDEEALRRLVREQVNEAVLRSGGKIRVDTDKLPEPVRAAAHKILGGATLSRAEQRYKDKRLEFKVKARIDGKDYDLRILPDGEVLEAEMPPDRAPEVIRAAAARGVKGIELKQVVLEEDQGEGGQVYDVEGKVDGKKYDIIIAPDGRLIEVDGPGFKARFKDAAPAKGPEVF